MIRRRLVISMATGALILGAILVAMQMLGVPVNSVTRTLALLPSLVGVVALLESLPKRTPIDQEVVLTKVAEIIVAQWSRELQARSLLSSDDRISVAWKPNKLLVPRLKDDEIELYGNSRDASRLATEFLRMKKRRLVIIGRPGSGKTSLAILLMLAILEETARLSSRTVPILLSLSSWNPKKQELLPWVASRISDETITKVKGSYDPDEWRQTVWQLVEQGRFLPVLDGLDELAADARRHALRSISSSLDGRHVVLTCRSAQYGEIPKNELLRSAAVIEAADVDQQRAAEYLRENVVPGQFESDWRAVQDLLSGAAPHAIREVAKSPLMLDLVRRSYILKNRSPRDLLVEDRSVSDITHSLFADFLDFPRRRKSVQIDARVPGWAQAEIERWLVNLARHLDRNHLYDIALWHLPQAINRSSRMAVSSIAALIGLFVGTFLGPALTGLAIGLFIGLIAGYLGGKLMPGKQVRVPMAVDKSGGSVLQPQGLFHTVAFGGFVGVTFGILANLRLDASVGLVVGAIPALAFALYLGWQPWQPWVVVGEAGGYLSPTEILRQDRRNTILFFGGVAVVGLGSVAATNLMTGGLIVGSSLGFLASLVVHHVAMAWFSFSLSRIFLAATRTFPFRLVFFLEYMYACGVLRRAGGVYQFRHGLLQDYLARHHELQEQ